MITPKSAHWRRNSLCSFKFSSSFFVSSFFKTGACWSLLLFVRFWDWLLKKLLIFPLRVFYCCSWACCSWRYSSCFASFSAYNLALWFFIKCWIIFFMALFNKFICKSGTIYCCMLLKPVLRPLREELASLTSEQFVNKIIAIITSSLL